MATWVDVEDYEIARPDVLAQVFILTRIFDFSLHRESTRNIFRK